MKDTKEMIYDIELIMDYKTTNIMGETFYLSTHRMIRGVHAHDLIDIIRKNQYFPNSETMRMTINIRGVSY